MKFAQRLSKLTRTDIGLGLIGFTSLETYIDMRKLNFLGNLFQYDPMFIVKFLLMIRLFQFQCNSTKVTYYFLLSVIFVPCFGVFV